MELGETVTVGEFTGTVVCLTQTHVHIRLANEGVVALPLEAVAAATPTAPAEPEEDEHA